MKILHYVTTGLFSLLMLFSSGMYIFNHAEITDAYTALGYPTYLVYPLAVIKLLGLVALWTRKSDTLLEWAYAGFFFLTILAAGAHIAVNDGQAVPAFLAIALVLASYISGKKIFS